MDIYRETIMDHYKNPRNKGTIAYPDKEATDKNTSCDDKIKVQVKLDNDKIKEIKFDGVGCAISMASSSLLTEHVKGMKVEDVIKMNEKNMYELLGFELDVSRTRCAMLGLNVLKKALGVGK